MVVHRSRTYLLYAEELIGAYAYVYVCVLSDVKRMYTSNTLTPRYKYILV